MYHWNAYLELDLHRLREEELARKWARRSRYRQTQRSRWKGMQLIEAMRKQRQHGRRKLNLGRSAV